MTTRRCALAVICCVVCNVGSAGLEPERRSDINAERISTAQRR